MVVWKNRPVLLTGATGFIGSQLLDRLLSEGAIVTTLGRSARTLQSALGVVSRIATTTSEIADVVAEARPGVVFHLASHAISQHTPDDIDRLVDANVRLPIQLCDAMARTPCRAIVSMGSAWQHANSLPYAPICLYAATKQSMQDVFQYYHAAYGIGSITLKLFHAYGPGEVRPRLVSQLCDAMATGRILHMSGGQQIVDLTYIDDIVEALLVAGGVLLEGQSGATAHSIASGRALTVRQLVSIAERVAGTPLQVKWGVLPYKAIEFFEPVHMGPRLPHWTPRISLEEGLRKVLTSRR
jgi:nucleoside-diphosphate-sugar epimerase